MTDINSSTWSQTDASNTTAPVGWPTGMNPSAVEPAARGMMGAIKRWFVRANATVTSSGSANTQTITYSIAPTALVAGDVYRFIPGFTNTGATTININSLGAISVVAYGAALTGNEIQAGVIAVIAYDGTNWQLLNPCPAMRTKLTADRIWYVDASSGDDANPGTAGAPWQTLQHAYDTIVATIDGGGYAVTINQQGTTTAGLTCDFQVPGTQYVNLVLNGTISTSSNAAIVVARQGSLKITGNGSLHGANFGIVCQNGGWLGVEGVSFAAVANSHIYAQIGGVVNLTGPYTISGNAARHLTADTNGNITAFPFSPNSSVAITLSGTRTFSDSFVVAATDGDIVMDHTLVSFSGTGVGARYFTSTGAGIWTNSGGSTFFPGSTSGTADGTTYGYYV